MPKASLDELIRQAHSNAQPHEQTADGYLILRAKSHPRTRTIRDTRKPAGANAIEMAATAAMRGATCIEPINRQDIHSKTNGTCYLCGTPLHINTFHIDHVIALYRGGDHVWANLMPACKACNKTKAARPIAIDVATGNGLVL